MYSHYCKLRTVGRLRAWYGSRADRISWEHVGYPCPPEMRYPGIAIILGSLYEKCPSYIRVNRENYRRGTIIETQKKLNRLRKRRCLRRYRAWHKRTERVPEYFI